MNINTWQQISSLKKDLYESLNILIEDSLTDRKLIASDLLSSIKKLNGIEEIYQNHFKESEKYLLLFAHRGKKGIPSLAIKKDQINFGHLESIANIKANLLSLVYVLLEDDLIERGEVACDLLFQVNNLNDLEQGCIQILEKSEFKRIDQLCYEMELKAEKEKCLS